MLRDMQCHVVQTGVSISDVHGHGESFCRELFGLMLAAVIMLPSLGLSQVTVSTLSSADVAGRLQGKSGSNRAAEIAAIAPLLKAGLAAREISDILGTPNELNEVFRANAIYSIAAAKKLGTLGAEAALILKGTTAGNRAGGITYIAPFLKAGLTAQEVADILGTSNELSEVFRANAIYSIATAKKLGTLGAEAALILKGTTAGNRAGGIAYIAPFFKAGLTAQDVADILGTSNELSEVFRANSIRTIVRAGKTMPGLSEGELAPVLAGMTGSNRALALSSLLAAAATGPAEATLGGGAPVRQASAPVAAPPTQMAAPGPNLTAISPPSVTSSKAAQIFSLKGSDLQSGARVTVYASNFQKTLNASQVRWVSASEVQMTIVTDTAADNWSVEVSNPDGRRSARVGFRVNAPTTVAVATPTGATPSSPTTTGGAPAASSPVPALAAASQPLSAQQTAQINATINAKLKRLLSEPPEQPPNYFFSTDNWLDLVNAAFRGNSQLREQYDGYYFGGLVYRQLAVKRLGGARQFVSASKGAAAQHAIAESDRYRQMMRASWAAAVAASVDSVSNAAEIQRLANTIYSASKITVLCGSSAVSPAAAAAFEHIYSVTDFGIEWADIGFSEAARRAVVDKSTTWLIEKVGITNNCAQLLATDRLFLDLPRRLETIVRSEEFKRALGDSIAASLASVQRGDPIPIAQLIIRGLTGGTTVALPKVGTRDMQLITLGYPFSRLIEVIDSVNAGFTQTVSGRRGDEAWTVLGDPAPMSIAAGKSWGLRAAVFENKTSNQCAIVFGGTELTDLKDWANNFAQWQGVVPPEYSQGADFAARAIAHCVGRKIVIAGHSLGGGIAQYAYLKTGSSHLTYTFNPAGLSTIRRFAEAPTFRGPSENVVAFIARAYDPSSGTDLGRDFVSMIPAAYTLGVQVPVPVYSWSPTPHFISVLAEGLGEQRRRCIDSETCRGTVAAAIERPGQKQLKSAVPSSPSEFPPIPFIDYGYQVDLVTGDWRLRRAHTLFAVIGDEPRSIGTLKASETVMADQIAIRSFNYEIYEVNEPTVAKFWNHVTRQGVRKIVDTPVPLSKGDRVVVLSYFGEGECRVWFKGKTYVAECPTITGAVDSQLTKRKSEIWVRVVTTKGQRGYLRDPDALGMSKHD